MSRLKTLVGALTALGIALLAVVQPWEGLRTKAYRDIVGKWTICYGETRGVKPGDYHSKAECDRMLANRLVEFEAGVRRCLKDPDSIPDGPYVAFISLAYNVGTGAFCRSTVARRANAGDIRGACDAILMWNRAGGRVVQGLVNRRRHERTICLEGLK